MKIKDWIASLFGRKSPQPVPPPPSPPAGDPPQPLWLEALLDLHNGTRAAYGRNALAAEPRLQAAAQGYADWCATNAVLPADHRGPGGDTVGQRVGRQGYAFRSVGENIARGQPTPDSVFQEWMRSAGHRQNVLNPQYTRLGCGRAFDGQGRPYWCCVFAAPLGRLSADLMIHIWTPPGLDGITPEDLHAPAEDAGATGWDWGDSGDAGGD